MVKIGTVDAEWEAYVKSGELIEEFIEYVNACGNPHPSSNAYMKLNRTFFFHKGMEYATDQQREGER